MVTPRQRLRSVVLRSVQAIIGFAVLAVLIRKLVLRTPMAAVDMPILTLGLGGLLVFGTVLLPRRWAMQPDRFPTSTLGWITVLAAGSLCGSTWLTGERAWWALPFLAANFALFWFVAGQAPRRPDTAAPPAGRRSSRNRTQSLLGLAYLGFAVLLTSLAVTGHGARGMEGHAMFRGLLTWSLLTLLWSLQWTWSVRGLPQDTLRQRLAFAFLLGMALWMAALNGLGPALDKLSVTLAVRHSVTAIFSVLALAFALLGHLEAMRRFLPTVTLSIGGLTFVAALGINGPIAYPMLPMMAWVLAILFPTRKGIYSALAWIALVMGTIGLSPAFNPTGFAMHAFMGTGTWLLSRYWWQALGAVSEPPSTATAVSGQPPDPSFVTQRPRPHPVWGWSMGLLVLGLGSSLLWLSQFYAQKTAEQTQARLIDNGVQTLSTYLSLTENLPTYLAPLLENHEPTAEEFRAWSEVLLRPMTPHLELQWAPNARLRFSEPEGLPAAMRDLNLALHPSYGPWLQDAIAKGKGHWGAPLKKADGGLALTYCLPVYQKNLEPAGPARLRGLAIVVLHLPDAIEHLPFFHELQVPMRLWLSASGQAMQMVWQSTAASGPADGPWSAREETVETAVQRIHDQHTPLQAQRSSADERGLQVRVEVRQATGDLRDIVFWEQIVLLIAMASGVSTHALLRLRMDHRQTARMSEELGTTYQLLDNSVSGMTLFDASGHCVIANETALQLTGSTAAAASRPNLRQTLLEQPAASLQMALDTLADGHARQCSGEQRQHGGPARSLHFHFSRLQLANGPYLLLQTVDVSDLRDQQRALEQALGTQADMARLARVALIDFDVGSRQTTFDRVGAQWLGLGDGSVPVVMPADAAMALVHDADRAGLRADLQAMVANGQDVIPARSVTMVLLTGNQRVRLSWRVYRDAAGAPVRLTAMMVDQTELHHALTQAQAANEAKSQFISNMSHEIRTPLNALLGYGYLLQSAPLDEHGKEQLDKLNQAGQALLGLVNDILDLSKIEAGEFHLTHDALNLQEQLQTLDNLMRVQAQGKGLTLLVEPLPAGVSVHCLGDALRLRQILINLLGNAIKFTEAGTIRLQTEALPASHTGRQRLRFEVSDTGIGIPPEAQTKLFARFQQVDDSNSRRFGGTGLGLAIVKELAERMGGSVDLHSVAGQGSTFGVEVELEVDLAAPACPPWDEDHAQGAADAPPRLDGLHVLVVDDIELNQKLTQLLLSKAGAASSVCGDGQQALDWLRDPAHHADAVLMDVQMPVMDGNAAVRAIRLDARLAGLPVIALTAGALLSERERSFASGFDDYLTKPLDPAQMVRVIQRQLERQGPR